MEGCLNCGGDSALMLSIELRGESLAKYCLKPECLEAAKFTAGSMKGQISATNCDVLKKEAVDEDKNK